VILAESLPLAAAAALVLFAVVLASSKARGRGHLWVLWLVAAFMPLVALWCGDGARPSAFRWLC
jgi:hypothetical protein